MHPVPQSHPLYVPRGHSEGRTRRRPTGVPRTFLARARDRRKTKDLTPLSLGYVSVDAARMLTFDSRERESS